MDQKVNLEEKNKIKEALEIVLDIDMKWNSNPSNYAKLGLIISEKVGYSIGERFLRDFFWDEKKDTFRLSNIDILYLFLYNKVRSDFLDGTENGVIFYKKTSNTPPELNNNLEKIDISSMPLDSIISKIQQSKELIHIFINEDYLKDKDGCLLLLTLFDNMTKTINDIGIQFRFDSNILDTASDKEILTDKGKLTYIKYWENKIDAINEIGEKKEILDIINEDLNKLVAPSFFMALKALAEIAVKKIDLSVDSFQPFIKEVNHIFPKNLSDIYKSNLNEKQIESKKFQFLCVIGYQKYLEGKEQNEMNRYFKNFNESLIKEGYDVKRIFTVPSSFKKNVIVPNFDKKQKEVLLNYISLNVETGAETYLFSYDVNNVHGLNKILLYQDYVIRLDLKNEKHIKDILYGDIADDSMLYLAYPEDMNGVNRMINLESKNEIFKYFEDFKNRMNEYATPYCKLELVNKDNIEKIYTRFETTY